jgi:BNR repeat protein
LRRTRILVLFLVLVALVPPPAAARGAAGLTKRPTARQQVLARFEQHLRRMEARSRRAGPPVEAPGRTGARPLDFQTVKRVKEISRDTLTGPPGSQPDTQTEPDIAIDPNDPGIVVATFQQGRFSDGGSADPGYATSHDGGRTWIDGNLPNLTRAVGGPFERASDPAVAFGPDGSVYITTLPFDQNTSCKNGVAVQRSNNGGVTFGDPVLAQFDTSCSVFNDKNWIAVDTFPASPHYGRVYVAWDRYVSGFQPIVLRYSDDRGETWSALKSVSGSVKGIGALPVVQPNGDLTIVYDGFSFASERIVAQTSHDGGATFDGVKTINTFEGGGPTGIRSGGLPTATVDPVTGYLYAGWQDLRFRSDGKNDIVLSRSVDGGRSWSSLTRVNPDRRNSLLQHFTPDVAAYDHAVHVTYRTRDESGGLSNRVEMRYIVSTDDGGGFGGELALGPPTNLEYAAVAGGQKFLGDYMGVAAMGTVVHPVWCRSSRPPVAAPYHQTTWSALILQ